MGRETFVWYPQVYGFVDPVFAPQVYAYASQVYAYAPVEVVSVPRKIYGPYGPNTYGPY
jgi:hypothetical protein